MKQRPILLIEDDPTDVELVKVALSEGQRRYELEWLKNGAELLARMQNEGLVGAPAKPALIILDLNLSHLPTGLELISLVKSHAGWRRIPLVAYSCNDAPETVAQAYDRGANAFLYKPVDLAGFTAAIRATADYWLELVRLASS